MKISLKKVIRMCTVAGVIITTGCSTPEIVLPPDTDVEVVKTGEGISCKNNNFLLSGKQTELTSFRLQDEKANIRDLAAFAICLYRKEIQDKLRYGRELEPRDTQMLELCLSVQVMALKTFTKTIYDSMLQYNSIDTLPNVSKDIVFQKDIYEETISATIKNYYEQKNPLRECLAKWGTQFQFFAPQSIKNDLEDIYNGNPKSLKSSFWKLVKSFFTGNYENPDLKDYKKYTTSARNTSNNWREINGSLKFYIEDLQTLHDDMEKFIKITSDPKGKKKVEELRLAYEKKMREAIAQYACITNDYPFSVFCQMTYVLVQAKKARLNDNELEMEKEVFAFLQHVSNTDMLVQIRFPYTASIYRQLLEMLKSELGETRWENLKTTCRLYEIDEFSPTFAGKNTLKNEEASKNKINR